MLPWKPNKMATCHEMHKLGRQSSNDHNCQIRFTSLHCLWKKCNLTIFPLYVYGSFLLLWQPNQEADHHNVNHLELSLPKQHLYKFRVILLQWFRRRCHLNTSFFKIQCCHGNQTKWPLVTKHKNSVNNHPMIITAKYGSHHFEHWLWIKCNLTIFPL